MVKRDSRGSAEHSSAAFESFNTPECASWIKGTQHSGEAVRWCVRARRFTEQDNIYLLFDELSEESLCLGDVATKGIAGIIFGDEHTWGIVWQKAS
jgi:hypothetical protein